ncbi:hypothetical protein D3C81_1372730 [compost metagenome]
MSGHKLALLDSVFGEGCKQSQAGRGKKGKYEAAERTKHEQLPGSCDMSLNKQDDARRDQAENEISPTAVFVHTSTCKQITRQMRDGVYPHHPPDKSRGGS